MGLKAEYILSAYWMWTENPVKSDAQMPLEDFNQWSNLPEHIHMAIIALIKSVEVSDP